MSLLDGDVRLGDTFVSSSVAIVESSLLHSVSSVSSSVSRSSPSGSPSLLSTFWNKWVAGSVFVGAVATVLGWWAYKRSRLTNADTTPNGAGGSVKDKTVGTADGDENEDDDTEDDKDDDEEEVYRNDGLKKYMKGLKERDRGKQEPEPSHMNDLEVDGGAVLSADSGGRRGDRVGETNDAEHVLVEDVDEDEDEDEVYLHMPRESPSKLAKNLGLIDPHSGPAYRQARHMNGGGTDGGGESVAPEGDTRRHADDGRATAAGDRDDDDGGDGDGSGADVDDDDYIVYVGKRSSTAGHFASTATTPECGYRNVVVIDNGSRSVKAGLALSDWDDVPSVVIPNAVGRPRKHGRYNPHLASMKDSVFIGADTKLKHVARDLQVTSPKRKGQIVDWNDMVLVWKQLFTDLGVSPSDHPLLITVSMVTPTPLHRSCKSVSSPVAAVPGTSHSGKADEAKAPHLEEIKRIAEIMFDTFHVPALYVASKSMLELRDAHLRSGLLLHLGHGTTLATPVYSFSELGYAIRRGDVTGEALSEFLAQTLPWELHMERLGRTDDRARLRYAERLKELVLRVKRSDSDTERECVGNGGGTDPLSDCTSASGLSSDHELVGMAPENRYECAEALFSPDRMGGVYVHTPSLHQLVYDAIMACPKHIQRLLFANVVISGGTAMFSGLSSRLQYELQELVTRRAKELQANSKSKERASSPARWSAVKERKNEKKHDLGEKKDSSRIKRRREAMAGVKSSVVAGTDCVGGAEADSDHQEHRDDSVGGVEAEEEVEIPLDIEISINYPPRLLYNYPVTVRAPSSTSATSSASTSSSHSSDFAAWRGGQTLALSKDFSVACVTSEEWNFFGPVILERKFF